LKTHLDYIAVRWFGAPLFELFGADYAPIVGGAIVLTIFWLTCLWMYRRGIFLRI